MNKRIISIAVVLVATVSLNSCYYTSKVIDVEKEKQAIRSVIARETETYYNQEYEKWKETYINEKYFRSYGYWDGYAEKVRAYNGFDTLSAFKKKQFEQNKTYWIGSTAEKSNENFRIYDGIAWYTFDQVSYENGTRKFLGKSVETRILEKQEGKWKIAYLGFHYYPAE